MSGPAVDRDIGVVVLGLALLCLAGCSDVELEQSPTTPDPAVAFVDEFTQSAVPARDILWILDRSSNFEEEAALLKPLFNEFIAAIDDFDISYQVGITTSDATNDQGQLQGIPKIITEDTPEAASAFQETVAEATAAATGGFVQKGFEAFRMGLSEESLAMDGPNYGFLRNEAGLSVIVVSNEDDASQGEVSEFRDFLVELKGGDTPDRVMFSAIVGLEGGCSSGTGIEARQGTRYLEMVDELNGEAWSICSEDYSEVVSSIGQHQIALRTWFPLTFEPVDEEILLRVNEVPSMEGQDWDFRTEDRTIIFREGSVPGYSSRIWISYRYLPDQDASE